LFDDLQEHINELCSNDYDGDGVDECDPLIHDLFEKLPGVNQNNIDDYVIPHVVKAATNTYNDKVFDEVYNHYLEEVEKEIACAIQELIDNYEPPKTPEELMCEYVTSIMEGIDLKEFVVPATYNRGLVSEIVGERLAYMDDELLQHLVGE